MGRHRKPKKLRFAIQWGWWPGRKTRSLERYRATYRSPWEDGESTVEAPLPRIVIPVKVVNSYGQTLGETTIQTRVKHLRERADA